MGLLTALHTALIILALLLHHAVPLSSHALILCLSLFLKVQQPCSFLQEATQDCGPPRPQCCPLSQSSYNPRTDEGTVCET